MVWYDWPHLQRCALEVERDQAAVRVGLTLPLNHEQGEDQLTKLKLIKRMMDGRARQILLGQRVFHALEKNQKIQVLT